GQQTGHHLKPAATPARGVVGGQLVEGQGQQVPPDRVEVRRRGGAGRLRGARLTSGRLLVVPGAEQVQRRLLVLTQRSLRGGQQRRDQHLRQRVVIVEQHPFHIGHTDRSGGDGLREQVMDPVAAVAEPPVGGQQRLVLRPD